EQPVTLFLLAGGKDDGRARELGVEKRAHGVAQSRRDVDIRRGEPPGGAAEAIGHRYYDRLLQAEHELQLREIGHHFHDRKLRGAGIAEKVGNPFVYEQLQKGRAARGTASRHLRRPEAEGSPLSLVGDNLLPLLAQAANAQGHHVTWLEEHRI